MFYFKNFSTIFLDNSIELHEVLKPKDNFYVSQITDQTNSIHKEWYQTNIMNCIRYRKS